MEGLNFDNILDDNDVESLFGDEEPVEEETTGEEQKENETENTVEASVEDLFYEEQEEQEEPKSVGSEEKNNTKQEKAKAEGEASPNFFSSIAESFVEEGLFPDLSEDTVKSIKTAQDLRNAIEEQMKAGLTEQQKRVTEALDNGIDKDVVRQYENVLQYLESITEETLGEESEGGEELRKRIIYQDYINKGFSKERAEKEVKRSLDAGTDIDDAKEALQDTKNFYSESYKKLLEDRKKEAKEFEKKTKERAERIKSSMLDTKNKFFDIEIDKTVRQKAFDALNKPMFKDEETGQYLTEIQKYEKEHKEEFLMKLGLLYAMTDGFKTIDKVVSGKVKKEVKKGFSELEKKINNTSRDNFGNLNFMGNAGSDATFSNFKFDI
jgi:hypothetical protein